MTLDRAVVAELAIRFQPLGYLRMMPRIHAVTPLGMGFGKTRFASPDQSFQLLYIARTMATGLAETIVRDRFEGMHRRVLDVSEIEDWAIAEISATLPLTVVDLRTTGLLRLGVSTDATRAKQQDDGRNLSQSLYHRFTVDGILYLSRLTGAECLAVYDRAVSSKLTAGTSVEAMRAPNLVAALKQLNVTLLK